MCGFCGFTGTKPSAVISKMTERISHRGPDDIGLYVDEKISLGFCRLSFFDLAHGSQPMISADNELILVFNGEIYNHKELREKLQTLGHIFSTASDTEVLLHLYEEYGEAMPNHLRGMFSFLVYEQRNRKLFAARDYFGIKPFYYGIFGGEMLFASEVKAFLEHPDFLRELNRDALECYLTFQYNPLDETFFKGVFKLPPAHSLTFQSGELNIARYWQPEFKPVEAPLHEIVEKVDAAVMDSVKRHQEAEVPIGSLLSGGTDSSYVAAVSDVEKTFTVGFGIDGFSEIDEAKSLSSEQGKLNISKTIEADEYFAVLPKVQYHMDEPLADPAAVALYFVCELASAHVKGVLSGEGADELFGGYGLYKEPLDLAPVSMLPSLVKRFLCWTASKLPFNVKGKNYVLRATKPVEKRYIGNANVFSYEERRNILRHSVNKKLHQNEVTGPFYARVKECDDITKMQFLDINLWLVGDILLKADKMSMANSLEVRVPFLDKEVFGVASSIPTKFRMNKKNGKYALRLAAKRHFKTNREKKRLGFPVPVRHWLKQEKYAGMVREAFNESHMHVFFDVPKIMQLLEAHMEGRADNSRKIWTLYMFSLWYREFWG